MSYEEGPLTAASRPVARVREMFALMRDSGDADWDYQRIIPVSNGATAEPPLGELSSAVDTAPQLSESPLIKRRIGFIGLTGSPSHPHFAIRPPHSSEQVQRTA